MLGDVAAGLGDVRVSNEEQMLRYLSMQRIQAIGANTPGSAKIALEQPQRVLLLQICKPGKLRQPIVARLYPLNGRTYGLSETWRAREKGPPNGIDHARSTRRWKADDTRGDSLKRPVVVELDDDGRDLQIERPESTEMGAFGWRVVGDKGMGGFAGEAHTAEVQTVWKERRWQHQGHKRRHRDEVIAIGPSGLRSAVELDPESRKFKMSCSALEDVLGRS